MSEKSKRSLTKRKSHLTAAADVLQGLLQKGKSPLSNQFQRWKLWSHWEKVVGPTVGEVTVPVGYDCGRLYLWVENSVRLQELSFILPQLKKTINSYLGKKWVHSIYLTLDRKAVPKPAQMSEDLHNFLSK